MLQVSPLVPLASVRLASPQSLMRLTSIDANVNQTPLDGKVKLMPFVLTRVWMFEDTRMSEINAVYLYLVIPDPYPLTCFLAGSADGLWKCGLFEEAGGRMRCHQGLLWSLSK